MPKRRKRGGHSHHKIRKSQEEGFISQDGQKSMNKNEKIIMGVLILCIIFFLGLSIIILFQKGNEKNTVSNIPNTSVSPTRAINTTPYPTIPPVKNMTVMLNTRMFNPSTFSIPAGGMVDFLNIDTEPITLVGSDSNSQMLNLGPISSGDDKMVKFEKPGVYHYYNADNKNESGTIIIK
jgi:plastocyanin